MRILVVDDVGYTRHYCTRLLQSNAFAVTAAASGAEAIRMLHQDRTFDVVLTDLMLRDMDGLDVFRAVQEIQPSDGEAETAPPAFLLMTAMRPGQNAEQHELDKLKTAKELGFAEVFLKPLDVEHLLHTLARIEYYRTPATADDSSQFDIPRVSGQLRSTIDRIAQSASREAAAELLEQIQPDLERLRTLAGLGASR